MQPHTCHNRSKSLIQTSLSHHDSFTYSHHQCQIIDLEQRTNASCRTLKMLPNRASSYITTHISDKRNVRAKGHNAKRYGQKGTEGIHLKMKGGCGSLNYLSCGKNGVQERKNSLTKLASEALILNLPVSLQMKPSSSLPTFFREVFLV